MAKTISKSVGSKGANLKSDILTVQKLLNANLGRITPLAPLVEDGRVGKMTIGAIEEFQRRVVKMGRPDGRVDPGGKTLKHLNDGDAVPATPPPGGTFEHPEADQVILTYGERARKMVPKAEYLLKSILASCGIYSACLNSTRRTYHDQARITITQTYPRNKNTVRVWYGQAVLDACEEHLDDIQGFADWWEAYDRRRGRVSSRHLSNQALDVVPAHSRLEFVEKVKELVPIAGTGVRKIIPKGTLGEPVDHVEFTFKVCPDHG